MNMQNIDFPAFETLGKSDIPVFVPPVKLSAQEQRRLNDLRGLSAIYRFGWLRAREIGNVLWVHNPTRHIAGAKIARRWVKNRLVISRPLPWGMGLAFVLSKRGADYLRNEFGFEASTGKKIGDHIEQVNGVWRPSNSWQHDLIANSFLTLCLGGGLEVMSELELSRAYPNAKKIPDGLWKMQSDLLGEGGGDWIGIEVERSNKWSTEARRLVKSLIDTQTKGLDIGNDFRITATCLVYSDPTIMDQGGGYPPDHFERAKRVASGMVNREKKFKLIGIPVKLHNGSVVEISKIVSEVIESSIDEHFNRSVLGHEWHDVSAVLDFEREGNEKFLLQFVGKERGRPFDVRVYNKPRGWQVTIYSKDPHSKLFEDYVRGTEIMAKRTALKWLLELSEYVDWYMHNQL